MPGQIEGQPMSKVTKSRKTFPARLLSARNLQIHRQGLEAIERRKLNEHPTV